MHHLQTINLIIERASGSRVSLNNELEKIYNYSLSNKNLEFEVVKKLTNLGENIDLNDYKSTPANYVLNVKKDPGRKNWEKAEIIYDDFFFLKSDYFLFFFFLPL